MWFCWVFPLHTSSLLWGTFFALSVVQARLVLFWLMLCFLCRQLGSGAGRAGLLWTYSAEFKSHMESASPQYYRSFLLPVIFLASCAVLLCAYKILYESCMLLFCILLLLQSSWWSFRVSPNLACSVNLWECYTLMALGGCEVCSATFPALEEAFPVCCVWQVKWVTKSG